MDLSVSTQQPQLPDLEEDDLLNTLLPLQNWCNTSHRNTWRHTIRALKPQLLQGYLSLELLHHWDHEGY